MSWNVWVALAVSALGFGMMHFGAPGSTLWSCLSIAIEAGLLLGAAYALSGNLWLPIGIHWMWNFTEGTVFDFNVSGGEGDYALLHPVLTGTDSLTGGVFGPEASAIAVVLGAAISVWFICLYLRRETVAW